MTQGSGEPSAPVLERLPTGIGGLDEVLAGGLVRAGSYLVTGRPGTGKTILANHVAHNHARAGGSVLFATVLAESHSRMLAHLASFQFFAPEQVARTVTYINIYDELRRSGLPGARDLLRRQVREQRATLLVIDGAGVLEEFAATQLDYRHFVYELHTQLGLLGCTSVLLADDERREVHPTAAHVDGIIALEDETHGLRDLRVLHVVKLRGSDYLRGRHAFEITTAGVQVYPRLESRPAEPPPAPPRRELLGFGLPGLDDMLRGGVLAGSATVILGAPGAGKTLCGLHFIAEGARRGERGLLVSFQETPAQLVAKAEAIGLELDRYVRDGLVRILWYPPRELLTDAWARELLSAVTEHRSQRLHLDTLTDLEMMRVLAPERAPAFLAALTHELRMRGVTMVLATEINTLVGGPLELTMPVQAARADNVILLRYVELRSQLHRLVSVVKARDSAHDTALREFTIGERGIVVSETFASAEAVLTGMARLIRPADRPSGAPERG